MLELLKWGTLPKLTLAKLELAKLELAALDSAALDWTPVNIIQKEPMVVFIGRMGTIFLPFNLILIHNSPQ
jgi:hypothetical protein